MSIDDALTVLLEAAQYAIEEDVDQARVRSAVEVLAGETKRRDEAIREALDVLTGWSRPMNNAERISFATRALTDCLSVQTTEGTP